jgi:putative ABC transport system permease protein
MLTITLGDLRQRARQFAVAMAGASIVFAMALVMSGMSASFRNEVDATVASMKADEWLVADGASGPLTSFTPLPESLADDVAGIEGVDLADPLLVVPQAVRVDADRFRSVNLIGHRAGGLGSPEPDRGRAASESGEAVADARLGVRLGDELSIAGQSFRVVGLSSGLSFLGGIPNLYVTLPDAQRLSVGGQPLLSTIAVAGHVAEVPAGLRLMSKDEVRADGLRVMSDAIDSVDSTRLLMWAVAAVIVAGLMYISAMERTRDFAVLKAMGASSRYVYGSLALQALLVSLGAVALSVLLAALIAPFFALEVAVPASAILALPLVAVVVGLLSSLAGIRRAVGADPAMAFGGQ